MTSENKFLYFHIAKTGGVAFRQILVNSVNAKEIKHFIPPWDVANYSDQKLELYKLIHGHFNFADIRHLRSFKKVVTLRDPVERCISAYNFWRGLNAEDSHWMEHNRITIKRAQSMSINEMLESTDCKIHNKFRNYQTRVLAGVTDADQEIDEEHLEIATSNLMQFDMIATSDQLETCKKIMCMKFGLYYPNTPIHLNTSSNRYPVDDETITKLLKANMLDAKLLEKANQIIGNYEISKFL
jgi:hypothetical protein